MSVIILKSLANSLFISILLIAGASSAGAQGLEVRESIRFNMQKYNAALEVDKLDEAIVYLKKVLELKEIDSVNYPALLSNLATLYFEVQEYSEAMQYYNFAISLNPEEPTLYEFRGDLKQELKDFRGALMDYEKAISKSLYYRWEVYESKGSVYAEMKKFDMAIANYTKAEEILNFNYQDRLYVAELFLGQILFSRGACYLELGKTDKGCNDLSKAGELGIFDAYDLINKYCN